MKKFVTIGLVVATLVTTLGMSAMLVPTANAASAGQLIKMAGNNSVYYLGADNKRYMFPNPSVYNSWFKDFSSVVTISSTELYSIDLGGNVTMRPGTNLVKITTVPKTYAVEPNGTLRWITSESVASSLYGAEWYKKVVDIPDAFWVNYSVGADLSTATYPTGTLVKGSGTSNIYYIDNGQKRLIADEAAFNANNFNWNFVLPAADLTAYADGTSITGAESALTTVNGSSSSTPATTSTGTLTVALASDTPASATVVQNATFVKFTKVNFTATGGDVTIDSLTMQRMGLAQDSNFANVYLLDASENMIGNEKTFGSTHTAVVNDDITIANGTTKSYWLAATMHTILQSGEVAALALSQVVVKGTAVVSGSLPITGNGMTMNSTISMGSVTQDVGATNPTTGSTSKQVGTTDYVFAAAKLSVNSTEDVQIEKIRFYQSGTSADADIANIDLVVDGVVLATLAKPTDKALVYDLSAAPFAITKGNNKTFELRGDIVGGSSRTIEFEFDKKTDIKVKGKTYGFYITPDYITSDTSSPYWNNGSYTTVSTGTLSVSKKILTNTYVTEGSTQVVLGSFNLRAQGEPVVVTQMVMTVASSTTSVGKVTNLTVYDENGSVIAGPVDPIYVTATVDGTKKATTTLSDSFTIPTGEHAYTVKADLDSNFSAGDTLIVSLINRNITAKGETTNNSIAASPTTDVAADTMTIRIGSLSVSTLNTPVAQTIVAGTSGFTFANFVLDASAAGEDIKITQLYVRHSTTAANLHQDISGIKIYDGSTVLNNNDVEYGRATDVSNATSTITLDTPLILAKGTTKTLVLKADIGGSATGGHQFGLVGDCLIAYGNSTGNSVTESTTNSDGQLMTIASNSKLTVGVSSASSKSDGLIPGSTDGVVLGIYNFRAQYADINLEELYLTVSAVNNGGPDQFDKLYLYDGTTKVAEISATTTDALIGSGDTVHFNMSANPVKITAGGVGKDLTVKADTSDVDYYNSGAASKGEAGEGFNLKINAVGDIIARANGLLAAGSKTLDSATLKNYTLYKSVPTVLTNDVVSGGITGSGTMTSTSNKPLYKFSVTADNAGAVAMYKVSFLVTTSTATATDWSLFDGNGKKVAATSTVRVVTDSDNGDTQIVELVFTSDGVAPGASNVDPYSISAGTTQSFTLQVGTLTYGSGTGSVTVSLLGDGAHPAAYPVVASTLNAQTYESNFIWSDLWRTFTTASATVATTEQWTNGYLVATGVTSRLQATSSAVTFSK